MSLITVICSSVGGVGTLAARSPPSADSAAGADGQMASTKSCSMMPDLPLRSSTMVETRVEKTTPGSMAFGLTRQTNSLPARRLKSFRLRRSKPPPSFCDISKRCFLAVSTAPRRRMKRTWESFCLSTLPCTIASRTSRTASSPCIRRKWDSISARVLNVVGSAPSAG